MNRACPSICRYPAVNGWAREKKAGPTVLTHPLSRRKRKTVSFAHAGLPVRLAVSLELVVKSLQTNSQQFGRARFIVLGFL